jgi:hypothetical protein
MTVAQVGGRLLGWSCRRCGTRATRGNLRPGLPRGQLPQDRGRGPQALVAAPMGSARGPAGGPVCSAPARWRRAVVGSAVIPAPASSPTAWPQERPGLPRQQRRGVGPGAVPRAAHIEPAGAPRRLSGLSPAAPHARQRFWASRLWPTTAANLLGPSTLFLRIRGQGTSRHGSRESRGNDQFQGIDELGQLPVLCWWSAVLADLVGSLGSVGLATDPHVAALRS